MAKPPSPPGGGKKGNAIIGGDNIGDLTEDATSDSGVLTIQDNPAKEAFFLTQTTAGTYGSFTLAANGAWTYTLKASAQSLAAGQNVTETFTAVSVDGTTKTMTMTVHGVNDAAVIGGATSGTVYEDNTPSSSVTGLLTISDVDSPASFLEQVVVSEHGTLTIHADGRYAYDLNNADPAVQALGQGSTMVDRPIVTAADGTQASLTMTIVGAADASPAVFGGTMTGIVREDVIPSTSGQFTATDPDPGQSSIVTQAQTAAGAYGTFSIDAVGAWTYVLDNANPAVQGLMKGTHLTDTAPFNVTSFDGTSHEGPVVTINGSSDQPVVGGLTATTSEDVPSVSGHLTISDADAGESFFQPRTTAGTYGTFSLATDGTWDYQANNPDIFQFMNTGESVIERFTVEAGDHTQSSFSLTIEGADEAPPPPAAPVDWMDASHLALWDGVGTGDLVPDGNIKIGETWVLSGSENNLVDITVSIADAQAILNADPIPTNNVALDLAQSTLNVALDCLAHNDTTDVFTTVEAAGAWYRADNLTAWNGTEYTLSFERLTTGTKAGDVIPVSASDPCWTVGIDVNGGGIGPGDIPAGATLLAGLTAEHDAFII